MEAVRGSFGQLNKKDSPEAGRSSPPQELKSFMNGNHALNARIKSATARISSVRVFASFVIFSTFSPPFLVQYSEVHPRRIARTTRALPANILAQKFFPPVKASRITLINRNANL